MFIEGLPVGLLRGSSGCSLLKKWLLVKQAYELVGSQKKVSYSFAFAVQVWKPNIKDHDIDNARATQEVTLKT